MAGLDRAGGDRGAAGIGVIAGQRNRAGADFCQGQRTDAVLDKAGEGKDYLRTKAEESKEFVRRRGTEFRESASDLIDRSKDALVKQKEQLAMAVEAGKQAYRDTVSDNSPVL